MKASHRGAMLIATVLLACAGAAAALAFSAAPALAFGTWAHDGANSCSSCHGNGTPTDATCQSCHGTTFQSYPGDTCWTCHAPGQDTSTLSATSSDCSQTCHLWDAVTKSFDITFTHGTSPHLGASGYGKTCLDCHSVSTSATDADGSPHHSGQTMAAPTCQDCHNGVIAPAMVGHAGLACTTCHDGMNIPSTPTVCYQCHAQKTFGTADCVTCHKSLIHDASPNVGACTSCHTGYQKHAGKVACTTCHTNAAAFHHGTQTMKAKTCASCHKMKHAGHKVPASKCASCHRGKAPTSDPAVQHSNAKHITKSYVCSACHSMPVHASKTSGGKKITCRTCHTGKYHAKQRIPSNSVCLTCHASARSHSVGYACYLCHRSAIHNARPNADMKPRI